MPFDIRNQIRGDKRAELTALFDLRGRRCRARRTDLNL
jgi:hypothetical protein